jgi:hypothetical protein
MEMQLIVYQIRYNLSYQLETEDKNLKGRGGKEDIQIVERLIWSITDLLMVGVHTLNGILARKIHRDVNIYLYKNGEYYQTIAKMFPIEENTHGQLINCRNRSEIGGHLPINEDTQVLSNALTNILPSEISYMN